MGSRHLESWQILQNSRSRSHLFGAGPADHIHDLAHGGAPHDGVVHQQHGLALEHRRHRVQLPPHAQLPQALQGLETMTSSAGVILRRTPGRAPSCSSLLPRAQRLHALQSNRDRSRNSASRLHLTGHSPATGGRPLSLTDLMRHISTIGSDAGAPTHQLSAADSVMALHMCLPISSCSSHSQTNCKPCQQGSSG